MCDRFETPLRRTYLLSFTVAPVKALCYERHADWSLRFGPLGVKCLELTGDSDVKPSELLIHMVVFV